MPLTPEYSWSEDEDRLFLTMKIKGATQDNFDILCTPCFIKVNSKPYLLALDLYDGVKEFETQVVVKENQVEVTLVKLKRGMWNQLLTDLHGDELAIRRYEAEKVFQSHYEQEIKRKVDELAEKKRSELREKIKRENELFSAEEQKKRQILQELDSDLKELKIHSNDDLQKPFIEEISSVNYEEEKAKEERKRKQMENKKQKEQEKQIAASKREELIHSYYDSVSKSNENSNTVCGLPPPRSTIVVPLSFTPTSRPGLPARDDMYCKSEDENVFLPGRGSNEKPFEKETNIGWLKSEGDKYSRTSLWSKAIEYYSKAISILPTHPVLSNRALAYYQQKSYQNCIDDCTKALELLSFDTKDDTAARKLCEIAKLVNTSRCSKTDVPHPAAYPIARILLKRGAAFLQLDQLEKAYDDYFIAHILCENSYVKEDLETIKQKLEEKAKEKRKAEEQQNSS